MNGVIKSIFVFLLCFGLNLAAVPTVKVDYEKVTKILADSLKNDETELKWYRPKVSTILKEEEPLEKLIEMVGKVEENSINSSEYQQILMLLAKEHPPVFYLAARYMQQWNTSLLTDPLAEQFFADLEDSFNGKKPHTQSSAHLATAGIAKPITFFKMQEYQPQLVRAYLKERELMDQGYIVFYHGQKSHFGFSQAMIMRLLEKAYTKKLVTRRVPNDFIFIRVPNEIKFLMTDGLTEQQKESVKEYRLEVLSEGNDFYYNECISVNGFLFAHSDFNFSCTWYYVVNNENENYFWPEQVLEHLFRVVVGGQTEWSLCFDKFKDQFEALRIEHESMFSKGRLLQIAIPMCLVHECAFISQGGSWKIAAELPSDSFKKTYDVKTIIYYLLTHQEEKAYRVPTSPSNFGAGREIHFSLIATSDFVLNPWSGIKVFGYAPDLDPKDTDRYEKYLDECARLADEVIDLLVTL